MNYKCMNTECGWIGGEEGIYTAYYLSVEGNEVKEVRCFGCDAEVERLSNYTRVPTTEPGSYWYRHSKAELIAIATIVTDKQRNESLNCICVYPSGITIWLDTRGMTGEWSERIEPPE
jgi:hypothetical protein